MKTVQVVRFRFEHHSREAPIQTVPNALLHLGTGGAILSGPRYGHIAKGDIACVTTAYDGADFHISVDVMVVIREADQHYRKERWYVTFPKEGTG